MNLELLKGSASNWQPTKMFREPANFTKEMSFQNLMDQKQRKSMFYEENRKTFDTIQKMGQVVKFVGKLIATLI